MNSRIPLILSAVFFFIFLSEGIGADSGKPYYGDTIVVSSIADARNLVPILASDASSADICGLVFNGLVKYDKDVSIVGDLADNWEILDEGLTIIFHLRRDVKWHDGAPFTAKDVEFTYRKLVDPMVKTPYSGDFERVDSMIVIDDHTVKVTYKEPFAPALSSWGIFIMPEHLLKDVDLNKTDFSRRPIGTGPYKFKSWKSAEKIELVSNHDYFEGRPYIDRYIYRIIPDDSTIFLELQVEGVDMTMLSPLQYARQTDNIFFKKNYQKFRYPGFGYTFMAYNISDVKFQDVRVRRAIDHAVNKEEIVNVLFFGLARVTTGPYLMDSWAYNNDVKSYSFDPGLSREFLAGAGWTDRDNNGWIDKDGKDFEFTVLVNQGNFERLRAAEMIQSYLKDVGIRMKIRVLEWSALINDFVDKKNFEAIIMGWYIGRDPDNYDIWHSSKTRPGEFNFIGYSNSEVDRLLVEGRRIFDQGGRATIYHKIHAILHEDAPYMFLYSVDALPVVNSRFKNISASPIGIGYNFIKWYVPEDEIRYRR